MRVNSSRRRFLRSSLLGGLAAGGALGAVETALAIPPFERVHPRIRGLALTAYSLKPRMRWWWGKPTDGRLDMDKLDMLGFLNQCAAWGLDGAEITSYFFPDSVGPADMRALRRRALLLGLDITGGAMSNNFGHAPDSDVARREMEYFRLWLDLFAELGAPVVRVFASKSPPQGASADQVLHNVIANLEHALPLAEKRGVMLGLENHDFVNHVDRLLRVLDAIDSPWLGVVWDSANLAPTPDPYAELARIAPHAIVAQVKVMTKVNGENRPADYARLIRILRDAEFSGPLVFEYEEPEDPLVEIPKHLALLRAELNR